jgi:hypothetical protein
VAAAQAVRPDQPLPVMVGGSLAQDATLMESLGVAWAGTSLADAAAFAGELLGQVAGRTPPGTPELP